MSRRLSACLFACAVATAAASAGTARAGGLYLPGNGPIGVARAGAQVVSVDDPSAIATNPAALAGTTGTVVHVSSSFVSFNLTVGRYGVYEDVPDRADPWEGQRYGAVSDTSKPAIGIGEFQAVPLVAVASNLGGRLKGVVIAAGLFAPTAYPSRKLGADYTFEDPNVPPPPTRYDVVETNAAVVLPSIAIAYRPIPKLDLGVRFSAGVGDIKATTYVWGLTNLQEWVGKDSKFNVDVKDNFIPAFGAGVRYRVTPAFELGAQYSSAVPVRALGTGDAITGSGNGLQPGQPPPVVIPTDFPECATGGTTGALKACVNFDLPTTATVGGRYVLRDATGQLVADLEANVQWEQWSSDRASNQEVIVDGFASTDGTTNFGLPLQRTLIRHNFDDTFSFRLGGSYARTLGPGRWTVRGGVAYDTAAAPEGWERADFDGAARTTAAAGASLTLAKVRIDVGGGLVYEGTRTQGIGCNPQTTLEGCNGGPKLPPDERTGPDPIQPLSTSDQQQQSPMNEGAYKSGYGLLMVGVTTWF